MTRLRTLIVAVTCSLIGLLALALGWSLSEGAVVNNGNGTITFGYTVATADAVLLRDAICGLEGYVATLPNGSANPESCQSFADRWLRELLRQKVITWKEELAERAVARPTPADRISIDGTTEG